MQKAESQKNGRIDKLDGEIIQLLIRGKSSKFIANKLKAPLSTVQRRTRKLFENELIISTINLNYEKLGLKRGLLHLYLNDGHVNEVGNALAARPGIISVAVHIGNSDLVALFVYKNSKQLLDTISECKKIPGVERVLWSEEVYFIKMNESKINMLNTNN
jgi:Lrp/AsnC family transcriptional regulator, regulator for asnA, asnC and gidA